MAVVMHSRGDQGGGLDDPAAFAAFEREGVGPHVSVWPAIEWPPQRPHRATLPAPRRATSTSLAGPKPSFVPRPCVRERESPPP